MVETGSRYSDAPPFCSAVSAWYETRLPSWERPPGLKNDPYSCGPACSPWCVPKAVRAEMKKKTQNGATARTTSRSRTTRFETTLL